MHKRTLQKPDGRFLHLYSREPILENLKAPTPTGPIVERNPHLRWHPLRGEWVAYASFRQNRTFLPPKEYNPFAPTTSQEFPTEVPSGNYDIAVFDNLFPTLSFTSVADVAQESFVPTRAGLGACEVVLFTQDSKTSLGNLPLDQIELLFEVWTDRYVELGKRKEIKDVLIFENRGIEMGVTLHHPHGQIYAYPFIPPVTQMELTQQKNYWKRLQSGLLEDFIQSELKEGKRIILELDSVVGFVPVCARYPYEVWIAPKRATPSLASLTQQERAEFARVLKIILLKYDALWNRPFPYLMVFHQAPTDDEEHPEAHVHIEIYPAYRSPCKLKHLAGTELGAGMFANDCLPEEKAAELQSVEINLGGSPCN